MTARALPASEWPRLAGTELETVYPHFDPARTVVIAVEHEGAIVGCWAVFSQVHVEGLWIAPAYRRTGSVARRLLARMRLVAGAMGARSVATAALSDDVRNFCERLGGVALPGVAYAIPLERG